MNHFSLLELKGLCDGGLIIVGEESFCVVEAMERIHYAFD